MVLGLSEPKSQRGQGKGKRKKGKAKTHNDRSSPQESMEFDMYTGMEDDGWNHNEEEDPYTNTRFTPTAPRASDFKVTVVVFG
jgi:hypothetical protein